MIRLCGECSVGFFKLLLMYKIRKKSGHSVTRFENQFEEDAVWLIGKDGESIGKSESDYKVVVLFNYGERKGRR